MTISGRGIIFVRVTCCRGKRREQGPELDREVAPAHARCRVSCRHPAPQVRKRDKMVVRDGPTVDPAADRASRGRPCSQRLRSLALSRHQDRGQGRGVQKGRELSLRQDRELDRAVRNGLPLSLGLNSRGR